MSRLPRRPGRIWADLPDELEEFAALRRRQWVPPAVPHGQVLDDVRAVNAARMRAVAARLPAGGAPAQQGPGKQKTPSPARDGAFTTTGSEAENHGGCTANGNG